MAARIRKGDTVIVVTGRNKGARGEVLRVLPGRDRAVVSGVNMVVRHKKPSQVDPGGLTRMEAAVHISNLAHTDPRDGKPTRIGFRFDDHGRKIRFARKSGEAIDV